MNYSISVNTYANYHAINIDANSSDVILMIHCDDENDCIVFLDGRGNHKTIGVSEDVDEMVINTTDNPSACVVLNDWDVGKLYLFKDGRMPIVIINNIVVNYDDMLTEVVKNNGIERPDIVDRYLYMVNNAHLVKLK